MKKNKIVLISIVLILIVAVSGIYAYIKNDFYRNNHHSHVSSGNNVIDKNIVDIYMNNKFSEEEPGIPYDYNKIEPLNNIPTFKYNNIDYWTYDTYIDDKYIDTKLTELTQEYYDGSGEAVVEIYKIKGLSDKLALAVKPLGEEKYYTFINSEYKADTMSELLSDIDFSMSAEKLQIYMSSPKNLIYSIIYYDKFKSYLADSLDTLAKNTKVGEYNYEEETGLSINFYIDSIKCMATLSIYSTGDMMFDSYFGKFYFKTGDNGLKFGIDLMKYLEKNGKGYIFYYEN